MRRNYELLLKVAHQGAAQNMRRSLTSTITFVLNLNLTATCKPAGCIRAQQACWRECLEATVHVDVTWLISVGCISSCLPPAAMPWLSRSVHITHPVSSHLTSSQLTSFPLISVRCDWSQPRQPDRFTSHDPDRVAAIANHSALSSDEMGSDEVRWGETSDVNAGLVMRRWLLMLWPRPVNH